MRYAARRNAVWSLGGGGTDVAAGGGAAAWEAVASNFTPGEAQGFLAPATGYYWVAGQANCVLPGAATTNYGIKLMNFNDPNELIHRQTVNYTTGGAYNECLVAAGILHATAGDPIRLYLHQNSGSAANVGGSAPLATRLSATFAGP
jgi:hypothetical protein